MRMAVGDKGANDAKVFLDGRELKNCIMADEEKGECLCYVLPFEQDEKHKLKRKTSKGVVKVVL